MKVWLKTAQGVFMKPLILQNLQPEKHYHWSAKLCADKMGVENSVIEFNSYREFEPNEDSFPRKRLGKGQAGS